MIFRASRGQDKYKFEVAGNFTTQLVKPAHEMLPVGAAHASDNAAEVDCAVL